MTLDIEKIKAQFSSWFDKKTTTDEMTFADEYPWEQEDTGNQMNLAAQAYYAGYKAALEAYDPDAIRQEACDAVRAEFKVTEGGSDTIDRACMAIIGAGKE